MWLCATGALQLRGGRLALGLVEKEQALHQLAGLGSKIEDGISACFAGRARWLKGERTSLLRFVLLAGSSSLVEDGILDADSGHDLQQRRRAGAGAERAGGEQSARLLLLRLYWWAQQARVGALWTAQAAEGLPHAGCLTSVVPS